MPIPTQIEQSLGKPNLPAMTQKAIELDKPDIDSTPHGNQTTSSIPPAKTETSNPTAIPEKREVRTSKKAKKSLESQPHHEQSKQHSASPRKARQEPEHELINHQDEGSEPSLATHIY